MRVLVVGSSGQVAQCLRQRLPSAQFLTRSDLNLQIPEAIEPLLRKLTPDCLVNAAAFTAVDRAETDYDEALTVNGTAVSCMAQFCDDIDIPLIHLSTDYVFPGDGHRPYQESDATNPINAYGRSKLAGEQAVLELSGLRGYVLRTSWVFSEYGNNFVRTMLRLGAEREWLNVVDDQLGRPTYAGDIAETIGRMIESFETGSPIAAGLYHCASAGTATWFGFAREIFRQAAETGLIARQPELAAITTDEFPTPARRPAYSVLDTGKLDSALNWRAPDWRVGVERVLQALSQ